MQVALIHKSYVYWQIKILQTSFEKGHPKNIPVKLFQNLTSGFKEEDFTRISTCPYSARSPHSQEPCLWTDPNLGNNFRNGSPKEHSCEIISKSEHWFQRRFIQNYSKISISLPWQPVFGWNQILWTTFIPFPNKPWFLRVCSIRLFKKHWEKEKLLEQFLLFSQCFLPFLRTFCHFCSI